LLRGISLSMGNLSMSPAVRKEAETQGGWKSLLVLAKEYPGPGLISVPDAWFDALRSLANLALHEPLQRPMLESGALDIAVSFSKKSDSDFRAQAVRLAGNLSPCCHNGDNEWATRCFSSPDVIKALGDAAHEAIAVTDGHFESLPTYASAYAKLSAVPDIALWLFDIQGISLLQAFGQTTGTVAEDVKVHVGTILAKCLRQRLNQRIVLEMLRNHDSSDKVFETFSTTKKRELLLKERDAMATGKDVQKIMARQIYSHTRNPTVYIQYARMLEMLAKDPSNHTKMLEKLYVTQLIELAHRIGPVGDAQASALRALRYLCTDTAEGAKPPIPNIKTMLVTEYNIIPILMAAAHVAHEDTRLEVCTIVRSLATENNLADKMVRCVFKPQFANPYHQHQHHQQQQQAALEAPGTPFLAVVGSLLATNSPRLQRGACRALEPFARRHKIPVCQVSKWG